MGRICYTKYFTYAGDAYLLILIRTERKDFSKKGISEKDGQHDDAGMVDSYSCVEDFYFCWTKEK